MKEIVKQIKSIASCYDNISKVMLVDAFNKENTNAGRSVDVLVYAKDDIFDFKWDLETRVIPQIDFHITLIQDGLDETLPGQAENDKITIYEKQ